MSLGLEEAEGIGSLRVNGSCELPYRRKGLCAGQIRRGQRGRKKIPRAHAASSNGKNSHWLGQKETGKRALGNGKGKRSKRIAWQSGEGGDFE